MASTDKPDFDGFFSDDDWEDAQNIAPELGEKFRFGYDSKAGDVTSFTGIYLGTRLVDNAETGEEMTALEFTNSEGDKVYCWATTQLKAAAKESLKVGRVTRIVLTGEQETKRGLTPVYLFDIRQKPVQSK